MGNYHRWTTTFLIFCFDAQIPLSACVAGNQASSALVEAAPYSWYSYSTYGAVVTEVEIDVLTGERLVISAYLSTWLGFSMQAKQLLLSSLAL
jgi:hypothetical protein